MPKLMIYNEDFYLLKIDEKNGRGMGQGFRVELKLQNFFGSYLAYGTTDKPITAIIG